MPQSVEYRDYEYAIEVLKSDDVADFEQLGKLIDDFPCGKDAFLGRHWVTNAIDCGSISAVKWILGRKVDLSFRDEEGYTPLLSAIERDAPDKYELLTTLLLAGAPVNTTGINGFTPAHLAAVRNDTEALQILAKHGADFTMRTTIDDYSTPLEEAERVGSNEAVAFLRTVA